MSYYDNVKDDVQDKGDSSKPNFDTLRQAAEEHSENEDEKEGDGTEIEVLNETGLKDKSSTQRKQGQQQKPQKQNMSNQQDAVQEQENRRPQRSTSQSKSDISGVEEKLNKIIDQNRQMIEILESFGS